MCNDIQRWLWGVITVRTAQKMSVSPPSTVVPMRVGGHCHQSRGKWNFRWRHDRDAFTVCTFLFCTLSLQVTWKHFRRLHTVLSVFHRVGIEECSILEHYLRYGRSSPKSAWHFVLVIMKVRIFSHRSIENNFKNGQISNTMHTDTSAKWWRFPLMNVSSAHATFKLSQRL